MRDRARAAVTAARTGDFAGSARQFDDAEAFLASLGLSGEPLHLSRSWIDQAYAYLAVRMRDWKVANERLTSAMQADLALEEDFGYEIFHIGRVHTLHLWLRAQGESGDRAGAVALAQQIVDYVGGRRDSLPIGSGWSRARAAAVPDDLKLAMTLRICSEVGTQVALAGADATRAFEQFTAWRHWAGHPVLQEVHEWAEAKEDWLAGRTRPFLDRAAAFLLKGRRETTLWYATAHDLSLVCASMRGKVTAPFCDDVRSDVATWRQLPQDVQAPGLFAAMTQPQPAAPYRHHPQPRRVQLFTVGLPRTGSTSLYTLFTNFRAGNEYMERETITRVVERHNGAIDQAAFETFLRRRYDEADLEMDSASFHHLYFDFLLREYPEARFVMTIRSPYDWANSYIKMIMGWHRRFVEAGEPLPQWMEDYGGMSFGNFSWSWVADREALASHLEPLTDAFVRHWAEANRRTLGLLPADRAIVIRTEALSQSRQRLADFAGIPLAALTNDHHSNAHPDRGDLLAGLGRAWVDARARHYGADVIAAAGIEAAGVTA